MNTARALKRFLTMYSVSIVGLLLLTVGVVIALFPYLYKQVDPVCGCSQYAALSSSAGGLALMISLAVLLLIGTVVIVRMVRMVHTTRQYKRMLLSQSTHVTFYQGIPIYTIDYQNPLAVCIGYFRPVVFISQTLVQQLSGFELFAVMQHEVAHAKRHDPLQRLLLSALPRHIFGQYCSAQEIVADGAVTDTPSIRSAFVKLAEQMQAQPLTIAGTWFSTSQARVNHWLGEEITVPSFRVGLVGVSLVGLWLVLSYQAFAAEPTTQAFGQCLSVQTMCESIMSYVVQ